MKRSLNETGTMLRKACVGAGLPVGLAEDLSQAGTWLIAHGHDGASAVLAALSGDLSGQTHFQTNAEQAVFSSAAVAICGPSAIDLAIAGTAIKGVLLESADSPLLVIGLAGAAAAQAGHDFTIKIAECCNAVVTADTLSLDGVVPSTAGDVTVSCCKSDSTVQKSARPAGGYPVDETSWQKIEQLAAKTYVPATEASRQKGAGAGMIDND